LTTNGSWNFSAAFSPDGRRLAVSLTRGWQDWNVQLWDVDTWRPVSELKLARELLGIAFSPNGETLATSSGVMYDPERPGEVRVWDARSGALLYDPLALPLWPHQVTFSPGNKHLAVSCGDGVARVFDVESGSVVSQLGQHNGFVAGVDFSHDGTLLATGDQKGYVWVWDWARGVPVTTFKGHDAPVYDVHFFADDQRLVTASRDATAKLWDRKSGEELSRFAGHRGGVTKAVLLPGEEQVVTTSQDNDVKVWSTKTKVADNTPIRFNNPRVPVFIPNRQQVLGVDYWDRGQFRTITILDASTGKIEGRLLGQDLVASPDGEILAVLHTNDVVLYDSTTFRETVRMKRANWLGGKPAFSPDGKWLAFQEGVFGDDFGRRRVIIMEIPRGEVVREIEIENDGRNNWASLFFGDNGRLLLATRWFTQKTRAWDTSTWRTVAEFDGTPGHQTVVSMSADGKTFAMSGNDGWLRLWDLDQLKPLPAINLGAGIIYSLAFDPEGRTIAAGCLSGSIKLWNLQSRQGVGSLTGHHSAVNGLQFSPDGQFLASGSIDFTIRLWHAPTWGEIRTAEVGGNGAR
jgi:WD40 repeat protein